MCSKEIFLGYFFLKLNLKFIRGSAMFYYPYFLLFNLIWNIFLGCLFYIAKALEKECYYLKGLAFKDEIYKEDPSLKSFCGSYFNKW